MFSQHFIECIFYFNSYEKHKKYNKFPQTERYILKWSIVCSETMFNFLSLYGRNRLIWNARSSENVFWFVFCQWEKQVFSERTPESRQTLQDLQVPIEKLYRWATLQYHHQNLPGHSWWELFVIDCFLWCLHCAGFVQILGVKFKHFSSTFNGLPSRTKYSDWNSELTKLAGEKDLFTPEAMWYSEMNHRRMVLLHQEQKWIWNKNFNLNDSGWRKYKFASVQCNKHLFCCNTIPDIKRTEHRGPMTRAAFEYAYVPTK